MIKATVSVRESWEEVFRDCSEKVQKIAYFGNSVTVQKNGYRPGLHTLVREFTGNEHVMVNAGIGGVGSVACNFLCDDLVVRHQPLVCFIETSLADLGGVNPLALIERSLRGMVMRLKEAGCKMCFFHLFRVDSLSPEEILKVRSIYSLIEEEFGINSIRLDLLPGYQPESFLIDTVHTHEAGAGIYAEHLFRGLLSFRDIRPAQKDERRQSPGPSFRYTAVLRDYMGVKKHKYPVRLFKLSTPFIEIGSGDLYETTLPDVYCLGLLVIADPDSGKLVVQSHNSGHEFEILDEWCHQPRIQSVFWEEPVAPGTTLRISTEKAKNLKLIGLLCFRETPFESTHTLFISHG